MPKIYMLWDLEFTGPSGNEYLYISNRAYTADFPKVYRTSWAMDSVEKTTIDQESYKAVSTKNNAAIVNVGGVLSFSPIKLVLHNEPPEGDLEAPREYDYLFESNITMKGGIATLKFAAVEDGIPAVLDFETLIPNAIIADEPKRIAPNLVEILIQSAADLNIPVHTERFNGMNRFWSWANTGDYGSTDPGGNCPNLLDDGLSWTMQVYYRIQISTSNNIVTISDGANRIQLKPSFAEDKIILTVQTVSDGVQVYELHDIDASDIGPNAPFVFTTVVYNVASGKINAWKDNTKTLTDASIVGVPAGTVADRLIIGSSVATLGYDYSSIRIWERALDDDEVVSKTKWINHKDEQSLTLALEFTEQSGVLLADWSPSKFDGTLFQGTTRKSEPYHGESELVDKTMPLALGYVLGAPCVVYDRRIAKWLASISVEEIVHLYGRSVPLVSDRALGTDTFKFHGTRGTIQALNLPDFGYTSVQDQEITITTGNPSIDGDYEIKDQVNSPYGYVKQGLDDRFTLVVKSNSWPLGTTNQAGTITTKSGTAAWTIETFENRLGTVPNTELQSMTIANNRPITPDLFCDLMGDPEILSTLPVYPPGYYVPPDYLTNVVAQLLRKYGPRWTVSKFPQTFIDAINHRVGLLVSSADNGNSLVSVFDILQELLMSVTTSLIESPDGTFSLQKFRFPENAPTNPLNVISSGSVDERSIKHITALFVRPSAISVRYKRHYSPMSESEIPPVVDVDIKNLVRSEYQTVKIGDINAPVDKTPTFTTLEHRRSVAESVGRDVLRLSQGDIYQLSFRVEPSDFITSHLLWEKSQGDLRIFGLKDVDRVVLARSLNPAKGILTVTLFQD